MDSTIIVAIISGLCVAVPSVIATVSSNKRNNDLIQYRIEELTKRVEKHNSIIERTFKLEGRMEEVEHDIKDIKTMKGE